MSVLMNAGKKAAQAKAAKELKKKKTAAAAAAKSMAANRSSQASSAEAPPVSNRTTSVWYWLLDGRPTTVIYHKPNKEVWCNGYLLETYESFQADVGEDLSHEVGDVVDFAILSGDTQRTHRGRIERIPAHELSWPACESSDSLVVGSHRLWVDDCHVPEHTDSSTNAAPDYGQDFYYYYQDDDDDDEYSLGGASYDYQHTPASGYSQRF